MNTLWFKAGHLSLAFVFCLGLSSCNKDEFYQKSASLENPSQDPTSDGSVLQGGSQGGGDEGSDTGTQGGVDNGVNGGSTDGGTTNGSSDGGVTGGVDGSVVGGADGGATAGADGGTAGGVVVGEEVTENFMQNASVTKKLDILWVIDNSRSMEDEQVSLGQNFSTFINDFITKNVDFKMAITTTDTRPEYKGLMVSGSEEKLNSTAAHANQAQFLADFASLTNVGINGSGKEKGLEATEGFMGRYSNTFIRSDAYLAVVILSDEEDQSPKTPVEYTDYLKSFKNESGLIKVYSIVNVTGAHSNGTAGYQRYALASSETAGTVTDIGENFAQALGTMGDVIINLLDSFALANEPLPGTLKVYVNDQLVSNYTYNSASHSIKFNENDLPPIGAAIKVTYLK